MKAKTRRLITSSLILLFICAISSNPLTAQQTTQSQSQGETVVDKVDSKDKTSEFADLLKASGFAQVLKKEGTFTVIAPSNDAIETSDVNVEELKNNQKAAQKFAQSHLYQGEMSADKVESIGVQVEETDDSPSNGVVHVVDKVVQK